LVAFDAEIARDRKKNSLIKLGNTPAEAAANLKRGKFRRK